MLIRAFVLPYVHYCSTTWCTAAPHLIKKIQSTIDKTHLFCTGVQSIDVEQRLKLDTAILTFKAINKISPDYICDKISLTSAHHNY